MKCPKCKGTGRTVHSIINNLKIYDDCPICHGTGEIERTDGIDYNRKIAVPEYKAKL